MKNSGRPRKSIVLSKDELKSLETLIVAPSKSRITDKAIRRGSFTSTQQLISKISEFTDVYNRNSKPFVWTATPKEIFEKLGRLCGELSKNELRKEYTPRINETLH